MFNDFGMKDDNDKIVSILNLKVPANKKRVTKNIQHDKLS